MPVNSFKRAFQLATILSFLSLSSNVYSQWLQCGNCHGMPPQYKNQCVLVVGGEWFALGDAYGWTVSGTCGAPGGIGFSGCPIGVPYEFHALNPFPADATFTKTGSPTSGTITITVRAVDYSGIFTPFQAAVKQAWEKNLSTCGLNVNVVVNLIKTFIVNSSTNVTLEQVTQPLGDSSTPENCGSLTSQSGPDELLIRSTPSSGVCDEVTAYKHEFGHLIGFTDSYLKPFPGSRTGDPYEVMGWGDNVKGYHGKILWQRN